MFFLPETISPCGPPKDKVSNPLLQKHFQPFFDEAQNPLFRIDAVGDVDFEQAIFMLGDEIMRNGRHVFQQLPLFKRNLASGDNPYRREQASWKRMLTTQPPVMRLSRIHIPGHDRPSLYTFLPPDVDEIDCIGLPPNHGLTMGFLYRLVFSQVRQMQDTESSGFQVMYGVQTASRDEFLQMAEPMFAGRPEWQANAAGQIYDQRAELAVFTFRAISERGLPAGGTSDLFWQQCADVYARLLAD
jgi:hypothetical protein